MSPHRVLHLFGIMDCGGAETVIMNVLRLLDRTTVAFDFGVHADRPGYYDPEITRLGGNVVQLPVPRLGALWEYWSGLGKLLRATHYSAVHSHVHYFSGVILARARSAGVPVRIAHSHTTGCGGDSPTRTAYHFYMRRLIYRHSTHMLACSRAAAEALYGPECWNDPRTCVSVNAIPLDSFLTAHSGSLAVRRDLGISVTAPLLVHVGRLIAVKNHRFLIEVFAALLRIKPDAHLLLVGTGPLEAEYRQLISAKGLSGKLHMLGLRPDVPNVLGASDVFVLPSFFEGIPGALIEAQAAGVPSVVSDRVSREADLHLASLTFLPLEAGAHLWAKQIVSALESTRPGADLCRRMIMAAGYDSPTLARRLQSLYIGQASSRKA